jgi:glycosyltransferase involved in cell wall biosynthesis
MDRASLSVTVITFNEEENLPACLESVKWADEIIVVDSFSTDRTVEIARRYTDKVVQREWPGHVEQKNFALEQATKDWVLCIDADERVSPELAEEIRSVLAMPDTAEAGYSLPRKTFYLGRWITHGGWYPSRKLRLVRRGLARWKGVNPHDHLYADGPCAELRGDLYHYTYKDISDHLRRIDSYTTISARELHERGKGNVLLHMLLNPPARFLRMYFLRLGFLDGMPGFILAALASYYVFLKYAKLWELRRGRRSAP